MSEAEMGELFKVIAIGKDLKALNLSLNELPGFTGRSRVF
jgi:SAM-dependent MidA family methyltransferase